MKHRSANHNETAMDAANRLHSLAIHLLRKVRKGDDAFGVSAPRLSALSVVVFRGPVTVGELAAAEGVRPPTMTRLVQALEADGLVQRQSDPEDARVARIRPTAKGSRILDEARRRRVAAVTALLADLAPGELDVVVRAVGILEPVVRP